MTQQTSPAVSELLPCPFCGSKDIETGGPCYDAFMCNECGISQYDQDGHAEAVAAWNRRASTSVSGEGEWRNITWGEIKERLGTKRSRVIETLKVPETISQFEDGLTEDLAAAVETGERVDLWTQEIDVPVSDLREAAQTIEALIAERSAMAAANDAIEIDAGLTENGNLWRFWAKKASDLAADNVSLRSKLLAAEKALFDLHEAVDSGVDIGNKSDAFRKRIVAARAALNQIREVK